MLAWHRLEFGGRTITSDHRRTPGIPRTGTPWTLGLRIRLSPGKVRPTSATTLPLLRQSIYSRCGYDDTMNPSFPEGHAATSPWPF